MVILKFSYFWTTGGSCKIPLKQGLPSLRPSAIPSVLMTSWNWSLVFSKFWPGATNLYKIVRDSEILSEFFYSGKLKAPFNDIWMAF